MHLDDIDLTDLDRFLSGFPHDVFTFLRAEAPVWWHGPTSHTEPRARMMTLVLQGESQREPVGERPVVTGTARPHDLLVRANADGDVGSRYLLRGADVLVSNRLDREGERTPEI